MMCLWYDANTTLGALESRQGATDHIMLKTLEMMNNVKQDFEVKRFMLGLSALLIPQTMPQSITNHYGNIFKALVYLSQRSVEIRQAAAQKKQKGEMAEVEEDGAIAEDDADDMGIDLESDDDDDDEWSEGNDNEDGGHTLYESPLDPVDEILNLHQHLEALQQNGGGELYQYLFTQIDDGERNTLSFTLQAAQEQA